MSSPDAELRWGVTSSSVAAEGVAPAADWSLWEREGRVPRSTDGAGLATDYRDDLGQFAALGCTDWRLTVEWARVEPAPGRPDADALDRYRDVLAHARSVGLRSWVTLHHGSLPGWYHHDEGGHRDDLARNRYWSRHVDRIAEELDELVDGFVPIDDPIGWAVRGYGLGSRPPGRRDPQAMREAVVGAVLAVHEAVRLLSSGRQEVMTAWRADPVHAVAEEDGRVTPEAEAAARSWDDLLWGTWLRAHAEGSLEVEGRAAIEVPAFVDRVDLVGLVHDHPVGVSAEGGLVAWPRGARVDGTGFGPEPAELAEAIHRAHDVLPDHTLVVAGHGIATSDESWRADLLTDSLALVTEAAADIGLAGYFHDSGLDGYEWSLGFTSPRGLIGRDRAPKPAADRFRAATQVF